MAATLHRRSSFTIAAVLQSPRAHRRREAAYPLIFRLFGSEMPRGKERKLVLTRLGDDLARIEKALGYGTRPTPDDTREQTSKRVRRYRERKGAATKVRKK